MRPKASDPAAAEVLAACDRVRDVSLPPLGVRLEDLSGGGSSWKLDDPQVCVWSHERMRPSLGYTRWTTYCMWAADTML